VKARNTEHGLLFTGEMVRAVLDGRKTVTRRTSDVWAKRQAGDLLWVRETFAVGSIVEYDDIEGEDDEESESVRYAWDEVYYRATPREGRRRWTSYPGEPMESQRQPHRIVYLAESTPLENGPASRVKRWTPAIHMPRWASRITLRVTSLDRELTAHCNRANGRISHLCHCSSCSFTYDCVALPAVTDAEARREGVADRADYLRIWREINGDTYPETLWRIGFEVVS
jgi:hypothetical protein